MRVFYRPLAVVLAAAVLAGCEDDPAGPAASSGQLSASYTGYVSGSINAEGAYRNRPTTSYAIAFDVLDTQNGALHIGGEEYRDGEGRSIVMVLSRATEGTYSFDPSCNFDNAQCAYGKFEIDYAVADNAPAELHEITGGTVTVAEVTADRMRGTFAIQAQRYRASTGELVEGETLTFTAGTFDVPVRRLQQ